MINGTTDLIEALDKGISGIEGNTGIIWLVTDNINDNSGSVIHRIRTLLNFIRNSEMTAGYRRYCFTLFLKELLKEAIQQKDMLPMQ